MFLSSFCPFLNPELFLETPGDQPGEAEGPHCSNLPTWRSYICDVSLLLGAPWLKRCWFPARKACCGMFSDLIGLIEHRATSQFRVATGIAYFFSAAKESPGHGHSRSHLERHFSTWCDSFYDFSLYMPGLFVWKWARKWNPQPKWPNAVYCLLSDGKQTSIRAGSTSEMLKWSLHS